MPPFALPTWPLILFGILEPLALVWAYIVALRSPVDYFAQQAPNFPLSSDGFSAQALGLTLQLANVLLLLAAMAVICVWTPHAKISRWYLFSVALADLGHIYATYVAVGPEFFSNTAEWNDMIWGNVGASVFLHINRLLTLAGAFGKLGADEVGRAKKSL